MQLHESELNDIEYLTTLKEFIELEIEILDKYYKVLLKRIKPMLFT